MKTANEHLQCKFARRTSNGNFQGTPPPGSATTEQRFQVATPLASRDRRKERSSQRAALSGSTALHLERRSSAAPGTCAPSARTRRRPDVARMSNPDNARTAQTAPQTPDDARKAKCPDRCLDKCPDDSGKMSGSGYEGCTSQAGERERPLLGRGGGCAKAEQLSVGRFLKYNVYLQFFDILTASCGLGQPEPLPGSKKPAMYLAGLVRPNHIPI